jgi:cytochrome c biogenesis protein CcmG/thiol:disulfide interchange protein DsbE
MKMKTFLPVRRFRPSALFALVAALLLLACGGVDARPEAEGPRSADFRLKALDGRTLGPKDFRGKVVVVDFWATWCIPCHEQARILAPIHKEHGGKGLQILAANVGEEAATIRKFLEKAPLPYPVLMDPGEVSGELGVVALPALMIIDKKGQVTFFEQGLVDGSTLRREIKLAGA